MKIIVPTLGGFGNQLFQLSALANSSPEAELIADTNLFKKSVGPDVSVLQNIVFANQINFPQIHRFNWLSRRLLGLTLRFSALGWQYGPRKYLLGSVIFTTKLVLSMRYKSKITLIVSSDVGYSEITIDPSDDCVVILGYFQSYKYQKGEIRLSDNYFSTQNSLGKDQKPLVVHIRRGDYEKNPQIGMLSKEYYLKNIPMVLNRSGANSIWLFTNDQNNVLDYVPHSLQNRTKIMSDLKISEIETLSLMASGYAFMIANSTFSWWASYLSGVAPEQIYIPYPWYATLTDPLDMSPEKWIRLDSDFEIN